MDGKLFENMTITYVYKSQSLCHTDKPTFSTENLFLPILNIIYDTFIIWESLFLCFSATTTNLNSFCSLLLKGII